jgi:hypothetical protein
MELHMYKDKVSLVLESGSCGARTVVCHFEGCGSDGTVLPKTSASNVHEILESCRGFRLKQTPTQNVLNMGTDIVIDGVERSSTHPHMSNADLQIVKNK